MVVGYGERGAKTYNKPYSRKSVDRLKALAPEMENAWVFLQRDVAVGYSSCSLKVERAGEKAGHARLIIEVWDDVCAADCPEMVFMREFAQSNVPAFGHVSPVCDIVGMTELELSLNRFVETSLAEWDRYLRGYSWVTVVPEVLASRLGGLAGLAATGAFSEVIVVAGGSVWLQATPRWGEYGQQQIERVFEVLAPVLPPGMPKRRDGWRLVFLDAAKFHSGR